MSHSSGPNIHPLLICVGARVEKAEKGVTFSNALFASDDAIETISQAARALAQARAECQLFGA